MPRKTTSLKIDIELWKQVKKHCIDIDSEISDYLEALIKKDLKVRKRKARQLGIKKRD